MRELRESGDVQQAIEKAAKDPDSRGFAPILNKMADYDEEKPTEKRELALKGRVELCVKIEREGRRRT